MLQASIDDLLAYKMMGQSLLNLDNHEDALEIFNIIRKIGLMMNQNRISIGFYFRRTIVNSRIISRKKQAEMGLDDLRFLARVEGRLKHENLVATLENISQKTDDADDWYEVARVAFNRKQYQDSIAATTKALHIDPGHEKSRTLRVRSLIIEEQYSVQLKMNELENRFTE